METPAHGDVVYVLTRLYFGETVATVIKLLFNYDQASLRFLKSVAPDLKIEDIKKALLILVKYQLVDYVKTVKNYEYSVVPQRIFYFYRIPLFIRTTLMREGQMMADALTILAESGIMSKAMLTEKLVKFTQHSRNNTGELIVKDAEAIITGLIHRKYLVEMSDNICINIERYNRQNRDDMFVKTLSNFYNQEPNVTMICKTMLDISFENTSDEALISSPVPLASLRNILCPKVISDESKLEKFMTKLITEVNHKFFISSGTHPEKGPMYAICIGNVLDHLVREHLCSVITTRFGPKCCRVFRILLQRGPLLLKQIEEFIMLPTKDVREYTYMLIKEGLVRNRQVPKTLDNAPGKSVFIMSVELDQVIFKIADLCCRTMSNLLIRYEFEMKRNGPLLDKAKAVREFILNENGSGQIDDGWSDYFNSHELSQLNWLNTNLDRLLLAKDQVDETLFLLHLWLKLRPNTTEAQTQHS